ncbi:MAG: small subunit ribosomal protein [Patescibacteria group bacterium]|nr:small subunit ribosomal protein [Patescibacteria group bacterium]
MARYTGPKHKLARREGVNLLDKTSASLQRRLNTPPGVHGAKRKRRLSEYGLQLREKQKAKAMYGVLEKQFKRLVTELEKQKGDSGELMLALLETRLDNLVYRLGFAKSRFMARQFVSHGHVKVNGKKLSIPSYHVKVGDEIEITEKISKTPDIAKLMQEKKDVLSFIERQGIKGKLTRMPKAEDVTVPFNTQQIIEYYSR